MWYFIIQLYINLKLFKKKYVCLQSTEQPKFLAPICNLFVALSADSM